ncbi:MAG: NADH:flavin oxidoreductase/NADH oxidase [Calditrichia bacterium]
MSLLFTPLRIRDLEFKNRIFVSPMCQYSAADGLPNNWHLVHLGSRAVGGAGLVMTEATAVSPEGRISPQDIGIWSDEHAEAFRPITEFIKAQGSIPGIQLAHAGRKASTRAPWEGGGPVPESEGGWQPLAPSPLPYNEGYPLPRELNLVDMEAIVNQFEIAAGLSLKAGFEMVEIHMAHGYLLHQFLSPLSNNRTDDFGGKFKNRVRLPAWVAQTVRKVWPAHLPVFVRISATDWAPGGWDLPQSIRFAAMLEEAGIDLIDCSSGGLVPFQKFITGPGYQTRFAAEIRRETGILTGAVGMITEPVQAEHILLSGQADAVLLAREYLRHPYWPLHAARELGDDVRWPNQYKRARI